MKPYSQDLREKVIWAVEAGDETQSEIAEQFGVSLSFVEKLWRRWRKTGSCAPQPHAGGWRRVLKEKQAWIKQEVARQADVTIAELCERLEQVSGIKASLSMMCRELQELDLPRKKSRSMTSNERRCG